MGPAQRICLGGRGQRCLGRRSALRQRHPVHQKCRRPSGLLARALARFRFWWRRRAYYDARLRSSGYRCDLSTLYRHRRLGILCWGIGDDGLDVQQCRRPHSLRRRITSRRQYRISEVHARRDVECFLRRNYTSRAESAPAPPWQTKHIGKKYSRAPCEPPPKLHLPNTASAAVIKSSSGLLRQCSLSFALSDDNLSTSMTGGSCSGK